MGPFFPPNFASKKILLNDVVVSNLMRIIILNKGIHCLINFNRVVCLFGETILNNANIWKIKLNI